MILKMAVALLGGGLTYSAWLVLFLSTFTLDGLLWPPGQQFTSAVSA